MLKLLTGRAAPGLRAIAARDEIKRRAMKNWMPPNVPLAMCILAAVAAVALRAAARRPEPVWALGTEPVPVTATAVEDRPQSTASDGLHPMAGHQTAKPSRTPGRLDGPDEQMRHVFHELHAECHHALCEVCGN
jgi:hypothetical protein